MSHPRRLLVVLVILLVVVGVLGWLARIYLSSRQVTERVASRLQAAYGAPVELREANLGLRGSSLRDVRIFEARSSAAEEPWLVIERAEAEIPLWDLLKNGTLPSQLTLSGVTLTLRFDRAGQLLTRIPTAGPTVQAFPDIAVDDARIILRQEGRPDFLIAGVHTALHEQRKQLTLNASVTDTIWGNWTVDGSLDRMTDSGSASVRTPDLHVTQRMLEQLPFVPMKIWQHFKLEADAAVDAVVRSDPGIRNLHYGIHVQSRGGTVDVPEIELHAQLDRGRARIQDGVVTLADVQVETADGEIKAAGNLDFAHSPWHMDFKIDASKLALSQLPKSWRLPPLGGRLSGHADLQVSFTGEKLQTNGSGQGMITGVRVPGAPESKPILLKLHPTGEGFRFSSPGPETDTSLKTRWSPPALLTVVLMAPSRPEPRHALLFSPAELANLFGFGLLRGVDAVARMGSALLGRLPQRRTTPTPPRQAPSYLEAQLGLDDVDVAQMVKGLNVPLPFSVAGRISFKVQIAFPLDTPRDLKTYRLRGSVTSPGLTVAGLELAQIRAQVDYAKGVLRLEELSGRMPAETASPSPSSGAESFGGSAQLEILPPGSLTASLTLKAISLSGALQVAPPLAAHAQGAFSGTLQLRVPITQLKDIKAWEASATISANRLQLFGLVLHEAVVPLRLQGGIGSVQEAHGRFEETPVTASAEVRLANPYPFTGTFRSQKVDLAAFQRLTAEIQSPVTLAGQLAVSADAKGMLSPLVLQTSGHGTTDNLRIEQLKVGSLQFRWEIAADRIQVNQALTYRLEGETLDGRFHLDGQVPSAQTKPGEPAPEGHLRIEGVRLGRLSGALRIPRTLGSFHGLVNLTVTFRHEGPNREPIGSGRFSVDRLRWGDTDLSANLGGDVLLRAGELRLTNLGGEFAQGVLRGQVALNFRQRERSWLRLTLDQVEAAQLLAPWPDLAGRVQGLLQVRLHSSLGRHWHGGGEIALVRGRVFGAEIVDLRLPVDWAFVPSRGGGQLEIRDSTAQVALGRVVSQARVAWGGNVRVDGHVRFFGLELRSLVRQTTELSQMGAGQVSGRFDFSGSDVRSLDDLSGTLDARLRQTQALQLPILQQLAPFLPGGQSSAAVFQSGSLRGRLLRGAVRIDQMSFTGSVVQLFVAGSVTLQGRLNLEVTANTGNLGVNPTFVRFLGLRLPAVGPVPVALLLEATTYFSNRLVHLRITGTVRSPVTTVEPLSLLTEEALRFFVNRANLPLP